MDLKDAYIGTEKVARMYHGDDVVFPMPVQDGLVLWYDFMGRKNTDVNRAIAEDLSGNGNDGDLTNFAFEEGSGYKDGLVFDGMDDHIRLRDMNTKGIKDGLTIEVLIYAKNHNGPDGVVKGNSGGWAANEWGFRRLQNSQGFYIADGIDIDFVSTSKPIDVWDYITCVTSKELGKLQLYRHGVFLTQVDRTIEDISEKNLEFIIGSPHNNYFSDSDYRMVRVYNRALSPDEITHNYQLEKERWNL